MTPPIRPYYYCLILSLLIVGCNENEKVFRILKGPSLGIDFQNTITTNDTLNALTFEYIYNGAGVGVADFNHDGLEDLFFAGNQVSSKLYINKGQLQFKDVTAEAGVSTTRWVTGVSVVDINQDGWMDIYLCVAGKTLPGNKRNLLFIHQGLKDGIPVFIESAKAYGLDDDKYSTMAAFFDYDKDGDLDMYLVNNWLESYNRNNLRPKRINGEAESTDRLYRNNGNETFTDASREAGILIEGYGLGINICDINEDSWPDIYVSNDFMSNDLIWINQHNGTFINEAGAYLKHQTHNGMGVDVGDFNNDELADIIEVDMLPPGHSRQKMMTAGQNYDHFHMSVQLGYQPQYMRNTLQLNRGKTSDGKTHFSEIAFMAGVAQTDWSWAPLFVDVDNDGWKDLFIANGYRKDVTDLDFIFFGSKDQSPFGTPETRKTRFYDEVDKLQEVKLTNYIFRNNGSLIFEDKTKEWGVDYLTFSNGTVYADLDNDGDLELITNNIDQEVIVYENRSAQKKEKNNYVRLHAQENNSLNEKIKVYVQGKTQYIERTPYRGFQSSVMHDVHFGLGHATHIDSIQVLWPDSSLATYRNVTVNRTLNFSKRDAVEIKNNFKKETPLFVQQSLPYVHAEKSPTDIKITRTLMHDLTRYGPCLAAADVNGDQLDDFFVGGEKGMTSQLFIQNMNGTFSSTTITTDFAREDGAVLFLDVDKDGDQDLYVGGSCHTSTQIASLHQLYLNDSKGNFSLSNGLPAITTAASCVESEDYDGDGDLDLFIGGRYKSSEYPYPDRSYILRNDDGKFTDVTGQLNKNLLAPGMVSSAVWADIDADKMPDLIITGEWMPIRVFKNTSAAFIEVTKEMGLENSNGWWNCLKAADVNHDGFIDIVAGNTGKNSYFHPTLKNPIQLYAKDFDRNGSMDPLMTYYNAVEENRFIAHNRMVVIDQIPSIKRRFETFKIFANTPFSKAFTEEELEGALVCNAFSLTSSILINQSGKTFQKKDLPDIAQLSVVNDILIEDVNHDKHLDLILVGNNYSQETLFGQSDASFGTILLGDGAFNWKNYQPFASGFVVDKDAKYIRSLRMATGKGYIVCNNNDSTHFYKVHR